MIHHLDCEKCGSLRAELMGKESTDLRSAKEVAVDHFMKCKHKTTVTLDGGTSQKEWTIGPLTASQKQSKLPQIKKGKKFAKLEYKFWPTKLGRMWPEEKVIEEFRSEILNAMNDLEKKIDSDVRKAPKSVPLMIPQSMEDAKEALSIAFRNLIGEICKYGKKESLPLEKLRPEILAIKDTLELIRLAREEFGKKIREDLERKLRSELDALIAGESLVEDEKKTEE